MRPSIPAADELLDKYFPVLDYGFVALKEYMGSDESIEEAARVSYAYGTRKSSDTRTLIRSLIRRGHTSPLEMVELKFHCAMPIFVARQWIRHRMASVNEMSGRYSLMPMLFYRPTPEQIQAQSKKDRQGRSGWLPTETVNSFLGSVDRSVQEHKNWYHWATENDIARELARINLPLNVYTQWYWKIDGNNLFKTLSLRCDEHAQWETRQYFNVIAGITKRVLPITFEAWEDYYFNAKKFSSMEMGFIRELIKVTKNGGLRVVLGSVERRDLEEVMTKTEVEEMLAKLGSHENEHFDLDLSSAKDPQFFEELYKSNSEYHK